MSAALRVLDTTARSDLMKGDSRILARLETVGRANVRVPQPVLAEIRYGIDRLERSARKGRLQSRFEVLQAELIRCPWTDEVSGVFGRIKSFLVRKGTVLEDFDLAIAAHAIAHQGILVTSNRKHMSRVPGLEIEDWVE